MSLLMDALRKAEQEKKEAAKRLKETETPASDSEDSGQGPEDPGTTTHDSGSYQTPSAETTTIKELSLAPIEEVPREQNKHPVDETTTDEYPQVTNADNWEIDTSLSENESLQLSLDRLDAEAGDDSANMDRSGERLSRSHELGYDEAVPDTDEFLYDMDLDETREGMALKESVQEDVGKNGAEQYYEETLPGVPAAQLAADIGSEDQPTPVAAQTVFTAGTTTQGSSPGVKWALIAATVIMLLAAGVWYYSIVTPINAKLPSPAVAQGIETVRPVDTMGRPQSGGTEQPAAAATGSAAKTNEGRNEAGMVDGGTGTETAVAEPAKAAPETAVVESQTTARPETETVSPADAEAEEVPQDGAVADSKDTETAAPAGEDASSEPAPSSDDIPPAMQAGGEAETVAMVEDSKPVSGRLPASIEPPPSLIKISRSKIADRQGVMLKQAYNAYKNQNNQAAERAYKEVLEQYPDNRDARLGLAAIALRRNQTQQALRLYARILELDPADNLARAALINLSKNTEPARGESAIKLMIKDSPDLSYLHFALGNIYASQSRWPEAQQAFFDAYRLESDNPDYAMNLAVSLDRMGKTETALDYYQTALELAEDRKASFKPSSLKTRIATLQGVAEP